VSELNRSSNSGGHVAAIQQLEAESLKVVFSCEREKVDIAHAQLRSHMQCGLDKHCA
jgi:hypothetical protein